MKKQTLKHKLEYLLENNSITKEDIMDILFMTIEGDIGVAQAIEDFEIDYVFEDDEIDLEEVLNRNDYLRDEQRDNLLIENYDRFVECHRKI